MARIDLVDLAHSYGGNRAPPDFALKPMTMTWRQGGAYALLGPSGCGKTTLLNIISGLVTPSRGQDPVRRPRCHARCRREKRNIAQVFQFPVIYDTMTVGREPGVSAEEPRRADGRDRRARRARSPPARPRRRDLNRKATRLTADAKQKISLGRGLVRSDVAAILFDEPLTVIDPASEMAAALQAEGAASRSSTSP